MNKTSILSVLLASLLLLASCAKKEKESTTNTESTDKQTETQEVKEAKEEAKSNKLVGKWEIIQAEGDMASLNKGVVYTFTETEMSTSAAKGKYSISGDTLIVNFENLQTPFKYVMKWEGEKLNLDVLSSGGQKFLLEKR